MTFKPTHRVKRDLFGADKGALLMKVEEGVTTEHNYYVDERGVRLSGNNRYVEPILQEEPMKLEPGKRYRFTIEGHAIDTDSIATEGGWCIMTNREGSVELLPDPLPTTPESVVRNGDELYVKVNLIGGCAWQSVIDPRFQVADSDIEASATVLFDAGATRGES